MSEPIGFSGPLVVEKLDSENWVVRQTFEYQASRQRFIVPVGSVTDFASQPRALAWILPKAGMSAQPATLHDRCWRYYAPLGLVTYREADGLLRQALRSTGVPFIQRWVAWTAVRWVSLFTRKNGYKGWWRDLPLALFWTTVSVPFVLPPAVVILAILIPIKILEWVAYGLLKPFSRKRVNKPKTLEGTT